MGYPPQYGRPPRGETGRGLAVVRRSWPSGWPSVPSSPCSSCSTRPPHRRARPRHAIPSTRRPRSVRPPNRRSTRTCSGSYGDFWDLWTTGAQGLITREEYARLFDLCPPLVCDLPAHHRRRRDHRRQRHGPGRPAQRHDRVRLPLRERLVAVPAIAAGAVGIPNRSTSSPSSGGPGFLRHRHPIPGTSDPAPGPGTDPGTGAGTDPALTRHWRRHWHRHRPGSTGTDPAT